MRQIARASTTEEMFALEETLPVMVMVRVSTMLLTQQMGLRKTLPDGSVYWVESVYFYYNDALGVVEAEPVMHAEIP